MEIKNFDVVIVGAGPAGCACAIQLAKTNLNVAIIDKSVFPRDKTCGDALSYDVVNQLQMLSPELSQNFQKLSLKLPSGGVRIFSPDRNKIDIPFIHAGKKSEGFTCKRIDFDNFLFQHVKSLSKIHVFENCACNQIREDADKIVVITDSITFYSKMIVGADGAHSLIAKRSGNMAVDKDHYSAGLRVYYKNVTGFQENNFIELHFLKEVLPGYLWIFPMSNNEANVGLGILSSAVAKNKINLKEKLTEVLKSDPVFKERFKNAEPLETIKGYGLPLGSKKRKLSGSRFLLTGDAASMIDPFSGEGIGNAIRCGRVAAEHIQKCFAEDNFSSEFNLQYDREIYRRMWNELRVSRMLQQLLKHPWLYNLIVRKANKNKYLKQFVTEALADVDTKKKLIVSPLFYLRVLFG
ncbi:geranylgeranyl reductase family protein [soil metagenome]